MWPFRKRETRSQGSYTDLALSLRQDWIQGHTGIADLTATVQGAVTLWENGLSIADTDNALLTPQVLAMTARALAFQGNALWIIDNSRLVPVDSYDLTTRNGQPRAYRVTVPEAGGGYSTNVLADELLHFRIGCDPATPWQGVPPLRRASLSAGLLNALESALSGVFSNSPLGSIVMAMPENTTADQSQMESSFRGKHGRVLLPESTVVTAAGGPAPSSDWKPSDLSPDLKNSMAVETLREAKASINHVFGILPALLNGQATGPLVREAQRNLAQWHLQPIAHMIAAEMADKTLHRPTIDVSAPLHAFDAGGRARAMSGVVQALAMAKQTGVSPDEVMQAAQFAGVRLGDD